MKNNNNSRVSPGVNGQNMESPGFSEGDLLLQALNGFVLVVTSEGMVFYVSPTIKEYLGFHQSDVVHQSVFELIHTDDRAMFREQLHFALNPTPVASDAEFSQGCGKAVMYNPEQLPPDSSSFLERSFVCRFRCLLDNSSGFLALKFHGRLKYLHGQNLSRDIETSKKVQLALFAIAIPVQPPSIVEIRAKMLLFQTKHKLDFTPTGVDSRGKIILGYTEAELCMRGSGYQFIHAGDMMHCADNHIRMIKTGESGLTVFRLLSKSNGWLWVNSNAKLIYKGGRPDFIIAFQKALSNAEGEEYLRQRQLQLPFTCNTGEAILYNTESSMDISQLQYNKMSQGEGAKKDVFPKSLLDCFLRQKESFYIQTVDTPLPIDQMFTDSHALVSFASNGWQENNSPPAEPVLVKEEAKQSVAAVIDSLEKLTQSREFEEVLGNLEVDDAEMMELENCFKRVHQEQDPQRKVESDLDNFITDEIVDFIDSVFKERGEECFSSLTASCLKEVNSFSSPELCEQQLFPTQSPTCPYSPVNSHFTHLGETVGGAAIIGQDPGESTPMVSRKQKLSHQGTHADSSLSALQQLQLHDIFSPTIELPQLTMPNISGNNAFPTMQTCHQDSIGPVSSSQGGSVQTQQMLQGSAQQLCSTASGVENVLPAIIPFDSFPSSNTSDPSVGYPPELLQKSMMLENHNASFQQWPQTQRQNEHNMMHPFQNQLFPGAGVTKLNNIEQRGLAGNQSSCMFQQHFSSRPAGRGPLSHSGPLDLSGVNVSLHQSHQGSGYTQWSSSESPVGSSATISPLIVAPSNAPPGESCNMQQYLDCRIKAKQSSQFSALGRGGFLSPDINEWSHILQPKEDTNSV